MKKAKLLSLLMVFALSVFVLAGCSGSSSSGSSSSSSESSSSSSSSSNSSAYVQDFTLNNQTGIDIYELYLAPAGTNNWDANLIPSGSMLANGSSAPITFSTEIKDQYWDLKVADSAGTAVQWSNIDLFTVSEITLTIENGTPTATFK